MILRYVHFLSFL